MISRGECHGWSMMVPYLQVGVLFINLSPYILNNELYTTDGIYYLLHINKKVNKFQPNIFIEISFMNNKIQVLNINIIISKAGKVVACTRHKLFCTQKYF